MKNAKTPSPTLQEIFQQSAGQPPHLSTTLMVDEALSGHDTTQPIEEQARSLFNLRRQVINAHADSSTAINRYITGGKTPYTMMVGVVMTGIATLMIGGVSLFGVIGPAVGLTLAGGVVTSLAVMMTGTALYQHSIAPRRRAVELIHHEAEVAYSTSIKLVDHAIENLAHTAEKTSPDARQAFARVCYHHTGSSQFATPNTSRTAIVFNAGIR